MKKNGEGKKKSGRKKKNEIKRRKKEKKEGWGRGGGEFKRSQN